ncbi:hypothetical protein V1520DRAFT_284148 [Lipomyces starkeyi]|uniref:Uncharacterized protein n=1 Tax=Lipomyces starkeyi NRRL Y-11557 TaxID=675824 RepID=A0A1E3QCB7_LIPST|nr:hypothetical protein LIPSTDRAFT_62103 [Lipomyces starkeyi NRRL Y-11557]
MVQALSVPLFLFLLLGVAASHPSNFFIPHTTAHHSLRRLYPLREPPSTERRCAVQPVNGEDAYFNGPKSEQSYQFVGSTTNEDSSVAIGDVDVKHRQEFGGWTLAWYDILPELLQPT